MQQHRLRPHAADRARLLRQGCAQGDQRHRDRASITSPSSPAIRSSAGSAAGSRPMPATTSG
jgi:hypothetical protein